MEHDLFTELDALYVARAKALLAEGELIDFDTTTTLLDVAVRAKGFGYVYEFAGEQANELNQATCINLHPGPEVGDLAEWWLNDAPLRGEPGMVPGCIVGHVAWLVLPIEKIPVSSTSEAITRGVFAPEAALLLDRVQMKQDRGVPWGSAVREAVAETLEAE